MTDWRTDLNEALAATENLKPEEMDNARSDSANALALLRLCAMQATEEVERLQRKLAEARAEIERKDAALKPFAEVGQWLFAREVPDDEVMVTFQGLGNYKIDLTRGHFKAASHRALTAQQQESDDG